MSGTLRALLTFVLLGVAVTRAASQTSDDQLRARVEAQLDRRDSPPGPEDWLSLGPRAAPVLEEIAQDPHRLPTRRARALEGLSAIGSPRSPRLMVEIARRESEAPVVRMSALRGAGRLLAPDRLVTKIRPVLDRAGDVRVRAAAAEVLAHRSPGGGCGPVRAQSGRENREGRVAFDRALEACRASPAP